MKKNFVVAQFTPYIRGFIGLVVAVLMVSSLTYAGGKGTAGGQFLDLGAGARIAAMGNAFGGIANDANALYWNPGGLAFLEKTEVTVMYLSYFQDTAYQYLAAAIPISKVGTFAVGVNHLGIANIERRTADTEKPVDTFTADDIAATLAYSRTFGEKFSIGLGMKMISSKIDNKPASGFAADLGMLLKLNKQFGIGLAAQNLGSGLKFINTADPLPMNIKLGLGYQPIDALTIGLDINMPTDNSVGVAVGAEYAIGLGSVAIPIRVGFRTGSDLLGLGVGTGIVINKAFGLDLAWLPAKEFGSTIQVSFNAKF